MRTIATQVYTTEQIELQDGTSLTLKPLAIKPLRRTMSMWDEKMDPANREDKSEDEDTFLDFLSKLAYECLEGSKSTRGAFETLDDFEEEVDQESLVRIIKVCMGIDLEALPKAMEGLTATEDAGTT